MPRNISSAVIQQLESSVVRPTFFVSIQYSAPVYVWSGVGNLNWNGQTWVGIGTFGNVSTITESSAVEAQGIALTLSGIPNSLIGDGLDDTQSGASCSVYFAFFDASGALIPDPVCLFAGYVDTQSLEIGTEKSTLVIGVESRLAHLKRARGGRYTDADQRAKYPNDASLKWVSIQHDIWLPWH